MELLNEPRIRAEKWFAENVDRGIVVGGLIRNRCYAPRLHVEGFRFICPWKPPANDKGFSGSASYPPYIITSNESLTNYDGQSKWLKKALLAGKLNYKQVACFESEYLYPPKHTLFSLAGWPFEKTMWISPEVVVFEKQ